MNWQKEKDDGCDENSSFSSQTSEKNGTTKKSGTIENDKEDNWGDAVKDVKGITEQNKIKMYVVIYNISKKKNVGSIIRSCVAFNVHKVFIIGNKRKKEISFFGNMGTYKYIDVEFFSNIKELKEYLKDRDILLYGCEITGYSISVVSKPFVKDTAFLFGNEGTGIDDDILQYCDKVIYIPQYGNGTSSLNVSVSCSIILHNFAVWASYKETKIQGKKFIIKESKSKLNQYLNPSDDFLEEIHQKRFNRMKKKENIEMVPLGDMFCA